MYHGNSKVILCERGVSVPHTHRDTSRFLLDLQVVVAAQEITHLPVVVDPSHATFGDHGYITWPLRLLHLEQMELC